MNERDRTIVEHIADEIRFIKKATSTISSKSGKLLSMIYLNLINL